jgi:diguanylate cyclase (GGDEF)-like protein
MTIKTKILLLGLLAIASLTYILGVRVVTGGREHVAKVEFLARMGTAEKLSALVHELQKERGISAGYVIIPSAANTALLASQRSATDKALAQVDVASRSGAEYLGKLQETREKISAQQVPAVASFGYYTQTILEILDRVDALARDSSMAILQKELHTHVHLLYAKEYLGQIRANINEALSEGKMDKLRVAVVVRLLSSHQFYSRMVLTEASPEISRALNAVFAQPQVKRSFEMLEAVLAGSSAAPDAPQWFSAVTYAIDQLLLVENQSAAYLRKQAADEIATSERRLWLDIGITLAAALGLIFFAASAVFGLLRALDVLITNIEHTISTQDFSNRIPFHSNDEMGVISHNFNELISIAEHLIKEKDYFASTDLLTGAYNRYRFGELFEIELQRVLRYGGGLALVMFDIDRFKAINDEFGHTAGDMVLKEIAHLVRDLIRANDVLVRWGGEEFMILVPHAGDEAADLAEKLCLAVSSHRFAHVPKVTASFGVSAFAPGDTLETLYARTDEALYLAKHQGRNRVACVFAASKPV